MFRFVFQLLPGGRSHNRLLYKSTELLQLWAWVTDDSSASEWLFFWFMSFPVSWLRIRRRPRNVRFRSLVPNVKLVCWLGGCREKKSRQNVFLQLLLRVYVAPSCFGAWSGIRTRCDWFVPAIKLWLQQLSELMILREKARQEINQVGTRSCK